MANITIREHAEISTDDYGLELKKSYNQDMVFINDKLAGYLTWADKCFKPLVGFNNAHNETVCRALEGIKGESFGKIIHIDAPQIEELETPDEEDDE